MDDFCFYIRISAISTLVYLFYWLIAMGVMYQSELSKYLSTAIKYLIMIGLLILIGYLTIGVNTYQCLGIPP